MMRLLFLGAGKRLSLFERFREACRAEGELPVLYSYEADRNAPVSALSEVVVGVRWDDPDFVNDLAATVVELGVHAVIPCMDGATVALAEAAPRLERLGCRALVSDGKICRTFEDKLLAEEWFLRHGVRTPVGTDKPFPWIAKPRRGFGARGQHVVEDWYELHRLGERVNLDQYIVQPVVVGPEYTVDAYVGQDGRVLGCVPRLRLEVVGGEVTKSRTVRDEPLINEASRILGLGGFRGPITLQAIRRGDEHWFLEINPRFGGGVVLSMEAGADYARLAVRELLGRPVGPVEWDEGVLMMRAYREVYRRDRCA